MCEHCTNGEARRRRDRGRIDGSSRATFVKAFEHSPDLVVETLGATKPNETLATKNYLATVSDAEDAAYRADFERRFFTPAAEVL